MEIEKQVGFELRLLTNAIMREIGKVGGPYSGKALKHPPSPMHGRVVDYLMLHQNEDIYQKDIENVFEIRRSTVSKILKSMEAHKIIRRVPVEHDARLKKIVFTEKAFEIQLKMQKAVEEFETKITKGISNEELELFFKLIEKMKKNLE